MLRRLSKFSLPEVEEKVLDFWHTNAIFEKSLALRKKNKKFVFYEGPPTANGRPGLHHVLARSFKDIILRYKSMRGFYVPRRAGWDTHGLPVELGVEKKLGIKSKKEIELYGIAKFNQECKKSVWEYQSEWEKLTDRIGFWLDMKHPYVTYENDYMESVWFILKQVWEKKLLYKGHKVVPWCTRCGTALSSHEIAQGYKETKDTSVYIKLKVKPGQKFGSFTTKDSVFILSWTTTPWTLPGNVALAVGEQILYTALRVKGVKELYIVAKDLVKTVFKDQEIEIVHDDIKGKDLVGLEYEPLFDVPALKSKTSYKVYPADFVTTTDGTGVVHTAVMYGEDDYNLGKKIGLPQHHTVDERGKFTKDVKGFEGMTVKSKDEKTEAETTNKILEYLEKKKLLFKNELYTHDYPFCWRCGTPLLYYARDSWFIAMSKLRSKLLASNKKINWIPETIRDGRFGEWLREVKDWAVSRERYWGTPLPVWECEKCGKGYCVGSVRDLELLAPKSTNKYIFVRHGEAESNTQHMVINWPEQKPFHLTLKGRKQIKAAAKEMKKDKIDVVFTSDLTRTKESAEIIKEQLSLGKILFDPRIREFNFGDFNGRPYEAYKGYYSSRNEKFLKRAPNGENFSDLRARLFSFVQDLEKKYTGKTILIVTHESCVWMLQHIMQGWTSVEAVAAKDKRGEDYVKNGQVERGVLRSVPRDETGAFDLHKPFIDELPTRCPKCKTAMRRTPEVIDVWLDSGAMPLAQEHFPFGNSLKLTDHVVKLSDQKLKEHLKSIDFPADYICEAMDQTRGWFYTLLALATLLGLESPYRNVIVLGLILDKEGSKMSKSKGNIVDPWDILLKHGADAIRWFFYTINSPSEPKRFDEIDLGKVSRQFFSLIYNSFVFYETYAEKNQKPKTYNLKPSNILDRWILARLHETIDVATKNLDAYEVGIAARSIEEFVGDVSRWYIRRSRRRLQKPDNKKDHLAASMTLKFVLEEIAKLMAPFTPFFAEALYRSLEGKSISIHVADWTKADKKLIDKKLLEAMQRVRNLASAVLAKRAELGIKVRQPLRELKISSRGGSAFGGKDEKELLEILKDEVNVKQVIFDKNLKEEFILDTEITHELREEGMLRELIRMIQGLRQDAKLEPKDTIALMAEGDKELEHIVENNEAYIRKETGAVFFEWKRSEKFDAELDTELDELKIWIGLRKL